MLLTSASAFGDASTVNDAAIKIQNNCYLKVNAAVNQGANRGVTCDLSNGQTCGVYADGTDSWTLSAPVYGTAGTFAKIGTGTVTLNGAMQPLTLVVNAGTLVLGEDLSFSGNPTITVRSGTTLRILKMPSGVNIVPEEGATVEMGLPTIPFDGTDTVPVQLTAADWAYYEQYCPNGLKVTLSQIISLPFSTEKRLPVVRITGGTADPAMFVDETAKTVGLPLTSFVSETVDGVQTIYLVARPVICYSGTVSKSLLEPGNWSDGTLPGPGKDYVKPSTVNNGSSRTGGGSSIKEYLFGGDSLTVCGHEIWNYAADFYVPQLIIRGNSGVMSSSGNGTSYRNKKMRGVIHPVNNGTTETAILTCQDFYSTDIQSTIVGDGRVKVESRQNAVNAPLRITGDNSEFTGKLVLGISQAGNVFELFVTNGCAFGGAMAAATTDGVTFNAVGATDCSPISLTAEDDVLFNAANRGWKADYLTMGAVEGKTLAIDVPTFAVSGALAKKGAGTLALSTALAGDGIATVPVAIEAGFVKALDPMAWNAAAFTVAEDAGFEVDLSTEDADVRKYGVRAASITAAGAQIAVKGVISAEDKAEHKVLNAAICTVPTGNADLAEVLKTVRIPHYRCTIRKIELTGDDAGYVTYMLHAEFPGIFLFVK